jgi:acyl dehydratase
VSADRYTKGLYFDDLTVDDEWITAARTLTEADLVTFTAFSGDNHPLHTDEEYCKTTKFGRRIMQGMGVLSIATGLEIGLRLKESTAIALLSINWEMKGAVFPGDTISVREKVFEKRESKTKSDRGVVSFSVQVVNQNGDIVQEGVWRVLMKRKTHER